MLSTPSIVTASFEAVRDELPELNTFIFMCYSNSSFLSFGEHLLLSDEGVQQGDPLGPLMFCLAALKLARSMKSEFNTWYLDDGTIGENVDNLIRDLETVRQLGSKIGLHINEHKCEIITDDLEVAARIQEVMPNIRRVQRREATLLGTSVATAGDETTSDNILIFKLMEFERLAERLSSLNAHDALFLLKNCLSTPKLLYIMRISPCYNSSVLTKYDNIIRNTLQSIINVDLCDSAWNRATMPVSFGGLGVRRASDLALPAILSSVAGSSSLSLQLLPARFHSSAGINDTVFTNACVIWQATSGAVVPDSFKQEAWDGPLVAVKSDDMLQAAQTQVGRARLIAAAAPHAGDYLSALPCSAV
jgi:hypothetical protein